MHRLHPVAKLATMVFFLVAVVSFDRYQVGRLLPYVFYPILVMAWGELPAAPLLKRLLWVEPLIIGVGVLNPVFDQQTVVFMGVQLSQGWLTFASILIKGGLTVLAGLLLVATTGMDKLAMALRQLAFPKLFVLQLVLTYRYLSLLAEELGRMLRAYHLRAPGQKGIAFAAWGSFAGQLLLRSLGRGERVYAAMSLRGFSGEYNPGELPGFTWRDGAFAAGWCGYFLLARFVDLPMLLGNLVMRGIG